MRTVARQSALLFAGALAALALSACSPGAVPQASVSAPASQRPGPAAKTAATGTPLARAPSDIEHECRIEATAAVEPLRFDWEKTVARGPWAAIDALAATSDGVLVVEPAT